MPAALVTSVKNGVAPWVAAGCGSGRAANASTTIAMVAQPMATPRTRTVGNDIELTSANGTCCVIRKILRTGAANQQNRRADPRLQAPAGEGAPRVKLLT